jgi:ubiquinone/menaquinone biosynthesis C-methylase UbiE
MGKNLKLNADRFMGFADIYDMARPKCPFYVVEIITRYLGYKPNLVVDLGCGTGLSTMVWQGISDKIIGIEPSADMIKLARQKSINSPDIEFVEAFSNDTGILEESVDVVTCSQSFHWMEPISTLAEVNRILKPNGVFAAYDCDWPPVCNFKAELAYDKLSKIGSDIEQNNPLIKDTFNRWDKEKHLENIKNSEYFRLVREIVFKNTETCTKNRFINIALSQGTIQAVLKNAPQLITPQINEFKETIENIFKNEIFDIDFCYRMRIGIK